MTFAVWSMKVPTEMFQIGDLVSGKEGLALKLEAQIPLDLYVIDLEGGLQRGPGRYRRVTVNQIASVSV